MEGGIAGGPFGRRKVIHRARLEETFMARLRMNSQWFHEKKGDRILREIEELLRHERKLARLRGGPEGERDVEGDPREGCQGACEGGERHPAAP
jgi:hypothetical protein